MRNAEVTGRAFVDGNAFLCVYPPLPGHTQDSPGRILAIITSWDNVRHAVDPANGAVIYEA